MNSCNICGGSEFGPGPGGRLSVTGVHPTCASCQSLERHRINRSVALLLRDSFASLSALQFSTDRTVEPHWFENFEVSIYGTETTLDLQKIDRESGAYDLVICNHVLEHVQYDNAAVNELLRVVNDAGFVFLSFPSPHTQETTRDWGFPKEEQHGHYRIYGRDVEQRLFAKFASWCHVVRIEQEDPVTKTRDYVYFLCRTRQAADKVLAADSRMQLIQDPAVTNASELPAK